MMVDEDVLLEIFKRLPTKSLCRFRCVCKEWNSTISSPFFRNLLLTSTPLNQKPYLQVTWNKNRYWEPYHPSDKCYALCDPNDDVKQQLYFPFRAEEDNGKCKTFNFVDIIHGVVCFSYWSSSQEYAIAPPSFNSTVLWNPSVHKYIALPCMDVSGLFVLMGFGYDAINDDFKVVIMLLMDLHYGPTMVYSTREGVWRPPAIELERSNWEPMRGSEDRTSCFVNGTIHWLVERYDDDFNDDGYSMFMFDCTSEDGRTLDIPDGIVPDDRGWPVTLFEYGGMLALFVYKSATLTIDVEYFVWVMEEHGDPSSWKKLYSVSRGYPHVQNLVLEDHGQQVLALEDQGQDLGHEQEDEEEEEEEDLDFNDVPIPYTIGKIPYYTIVKSDFAIEIEKMVPYGPSNYEWGERLGILRNHVYNHSMFLMDGPKAQSYTDQDTVPILIPKD